MATVEDVPLQEVLGQPNYSELLMRALRLRGDLPRALLPVYSVGFQMADFDREEFSWLRRSIIYDGGVGVPAVAAQVPIAVLASRQGVASSGRNVLCVCDEIIISNPNAAALDVYWGVILTGTLIADPTANTYRRDDRGPTQLTASYYATSSGNNAANPLAASNAQAELGVAATLCVKGPWVLTNRDTGAFRSALVVSGGDLNTQLRVAFKWREREVLDTEL